MIKIMEMHKEHAHSETCQHTSVGLRHNSALASRRICLSAGSSCLSIHSIGNDSTSIEALSEEAMFNIKKKHTKQAKLMEVD